MNKPEIHLNEQELDELYEALTKVETKEEAKEFFG